MESPDNADSPGDATNVQALPCPSKPPTASTGPPSTIVSSLKQQIGQLRTQHSRLQLDHQKEVQKLEQKIQQLEDKGRDLVKDKTSLQAEATALHKEKRLFSQRESALRAALEKSETTSKTFSDKSNKYLVLQKKVEDLEKTQAEAKRRSQVQLYDLQKELDVSRKTAADYKSELETQCQLVESLNSQIFQLNSTVKGWELDAKSLDAKLRKADQEKVRLQADLKTLDEVTNKEMKERYTADILSRDQKTAQLSANLAEEKRRRHETEQTLFEFEKNSKTNMKECGERTGNLEREIDQQAAIIENLQGSIKSLKRDRQERIEEVRKSTNELEQAYLTINAAARAYGQLSATSIHSSTHKRLKEENAKLKLRVAGLERKIGDKEAHLGELLILAGQGDERRALLEEELFEAHGQLRRLSDDLHQTSLQEKQLWHSIVGTLSDNTARDAWMSHLELLQGKVESHEQCGTFDAFSLQLCRADVAEAKGSADSLYIHFTEAQSWNRRLQLKANSLENTRLALAEELKTLQESQEELQSQLAEREKHLVKTKSDLDDLHRLHDQMEDELRADAVKAEAALAAEMVKSKDLSGKLALRVNNEDALRADYNELATRFQDLHRYEEAYHSLMRQVDVLVSRNALAEDEADRLSQMNAEILGHTNPNQKILYVDRIRRELADTKQSLVAMICERDSALVTQEELKAELVMYKSTAGAATRTTMTRVQRIPLSSRTNGLAKSVRADVPKSGHESQLDGCMTLDEVL